MRSSFLILCLVSSASATVGGFWPKHSTAAFPDSEPLAKSPLTRNWDLSNTKIEASRGGGGGASPGIPFQRIASLTVEGVVKGVQILFPPTVLVLRAVVSFYRSLPKDVILAQVGLVYCFCGGYFPALFAALEAARHCGLERMVAALDDLTDEAVIAVDATREQVDFSELSYSEAILQTTSIIMKAVDPSKINSACAALYTTWLGVSTVLSQEFARTITLAVTLGSYAEPFVTKVAAPPAYYCVPKDYHKWVPITLGWVTRAITMRIAWRVQRVLTAGTSAVTGGLIFARAIKRMLNKRGIRLPDAAGGDVRETTLFDETFGLTVASLGLYTQLGDGKFDPKVKFPFTLLTWPFDIAENWIQWQITNADNK